MYDSLAGRDSIVQEYFWCSLFADVKSALTEAEDLKISHQYDDDKRGRVMSLYIMAFSTIPFGNLFAGALAEKIGASYTLTIAGIFCILGSVFFAKQLPTLK
ncbi:hypothetical protein [Argonema antarcticum]|uniref:hypothetical protein n=1 Tax=Argonema antarcticum TaxID=2942763 RepID=UPI0020112722|nr:hypothetical protein [Argonema antarcticum]MCL1470813.1 hypothetical protein [Argonema antarcticum A004/B2]